MPFDPNRPFTAGKPKFDPARAFSPASQSNGAQPSPEDKARMSNKYDADQYRRAVQANPEVAEYANGRVPRGRQNQDSEQGLGAPYIDPVDTGIALSSMGAGPAAKSAAKAGIDAGEATLRAPGRVVDKLSNFMLGKARNLEEKQVQTYLADPAAAKFYRSAPALERQGAARDAINTAQDALGVRARDINNQISSKVAGQTIPGDQLTNAGRYAPKQLFNPAEGVEVPASTGHYLEQTPAYSRITKPATPRDVPMQEVVDAWREANSTPWKPDPITGRPTPPEGSAEAGSFLRDKLHGIDPELGQLKQGIDAQRPLKGAVKKPLSYMNGREDAEGARQAADQLVGSNLDQTAQQYQLGRQLRKPPHSSFDKLIHPVAELGLDAKAAIAPVTEAPGKAISAAARGARGAVDMLPDGIPGVPTNSSVPTVDALTRDMQLRKLLGMPPTQTQDTQ